MVSNSQNNPFDLKIDHLINSSIFLSDKVPQVSQYLMRKAVCYLKDVKKELKRDDLICKHCGAVLLPGFNVEFLSVKTTSKDRKIRYKRNPTNEKSGSDKNIHHKNKLLYNCGVCGSGGSLPGILKKH